MPPIKNIEIYTTASCPYCIQAKNLLAKQNLTYQEIRVDLDPAKKEEMLERSQGRRTVPEIFINNILIGGYTELFAMHQRREI